MKGRGKKMNILLERGYVLRATGEFKTVNA